MNLSTSDDGIQIKKIAFYIFVAFFTTVFFLELYRFIQIITEDRSKKIESDKKIKLEETTSSYFPLYRKRFINQHYDHYKICAALKEELIKCKKIAIEPNSEYLDPQDGTFSDSFSTNLQNVLNNIYKIGNKTFSQKLSINTSHDNYEVKLNQGARINYFLKYFYEAAPSDNDNRQKHVNLASTAQKRDIFASEVNTDEVIDFLEKFIQKYSSETEVGKFNNFIFDSLEPSLSLLTFFLNGYEYENDRIYMKGQELILGKKSEPFLFLSNILKVFEIGKIIYDSGLGISKYAIMQKHKSKLFEPDDELNTFRVKQGLKISSRLSDEIFGLLEWESLQREYGELIFQVFSMKNLLDRLIFIQLTASNNLDINTAVEILVDFFSRTWEKESHTNEEETMDEDSDEVTSRGRYEEKISKTIGREANSVVAKFYLKLDKLKLKNERGGKDTNREDRVN